VINIEHGAFRNGAIDNGVIIYIIYTPLWSAAAITAAAEIQNDTHGDCEAPPYGMHRHQKEILLNIYMYDMLRSESEAHREGRHAASSYIKYF
jgi:hypothetical protein